ncbi:hypothetical protein JL721_2849 [Aureococcus anophagefferens]|nr:hypothetical protein JL721_2849 [Aureococcus anophagefferens]
MTELPTVSPLRRDAEDVEDAEVAEDVEPPASSVRFGAAPRQGTAASARPTSFSERPTSLFADPRPRAAAPAWLASLGRRCAWAARRYAERNAIQLRSAVRDFCTRFAKHITSCAVCVVVLAAYRADAQELAVLVSAPADVVMNLWLWQFFFPKERIASPGVVAGAAGTVAAITALKLVAEYERTPAAVNAYAFCYYGLLFGFFPITAGRERRRRLGNVATKADAGAAVVLVCLIALHLCHLQLALCLWINQIMPLFMGDLLLYNLTTSDTNFWVFLSVYWGSSTILLQVIKRSADVALGGHDDEDVNDFVNITFRDGDVKGQFEQHYLCRSCKKGKEFERELRSTWRMLAINNCLSEVVFSAVAFDAIDVGRPVVAPDASPRKHRNILTGLALVFLVLKLAHLACASIWDRRMRALSGDVEGSVATGAAPPAGAGVAMPAAGRRPPMKRAGTQRRSQVDRRSLASIQSSLNNLSTHLDSHASRAYYLQKHYPFFAAVLYCTIANALKATVAINDHERGSIASVETA